MKTYPKWGAVNNIVTNNDPRDFARLENYFDVIVIDAPCSGSGLFRRDPDAIKEWSEEAVNLCSNRQQRILSDAYPALKQNGILIYSTCSYSAEEDEEICDWICGNFNVEPLAIEINPEWNIVETSSTKHHSSGYRFFLTIYKARGSLLPVSGKTTERDLLITIRKKINCQNLQLRKRKLLNHG